MIDQRKRATKAEEIRQRLEKMAEEGVVPFALLQECAATRGIEFRGRKPEDTQLRSDTFRVANRAHRRSSVAPAPKPAETGPATPEHRATLLEELESAMSINGLVPATDLERVAYHEAGHVVINRHLRQQDHRFTVLSVEIGLTPRNVFVGVPGGLAVGNTLRLGPGYGRPYVQTLLGGLVTETLAFGGIDSDQDTSSDVQKALHEISDEEGRLGDLWRTTTRLLIDRWANVEVLAAALLRHRKLSGAQVDGLLGET